MVGNDGKAVGSIEGCDGMTLLGLVDGLVEGSDDGDVGIDVGSVVGDVGRLVTGGFVGLDGRYVG